MREFTEKMHAFLVGSFYDLLTRRFGERGQAAFVHATRRYAEQRGARMAQRAIRDGRPLNFLTYAEYGEWTPSQTAKDEGCENRSTVERWSPDLTRRITQCPWAAQFAEMGLKEAGRVYCAHVDRSIVRGFNPDLRFDVIQTLHDCDCCVQISRGANFVPGQAVPDRSEHRKGFDYHCAHACKTFGETAAAIFDAAGRDVAKEVLSRFAAQYGGSCAESIKALGETNFNVI
ncbi:MAG: L-2-amino-thiazoline-4-carboxylic acid hydrolase [Pyramidobacter sp.]|uniref:L-2-amino-thiazoline-4-carboxylic acid hydrolase n=1 Tax=Pyramidobacter sp. TaxID=1943581 RepID=UPI002A823CA9|nr:L-2-amino-thiazoline-4-carboxylic acid hydrolase [Pyramidobacter sp.]MDY4031924.1 L-2-amino-thiazoline-4-carboxylic acid hydrolase [Pyramidobacter sp.]